MNVTVSDFTAVERELVAKLLQHRYGKPVEPEMADSELKLDAASGELTLCPTLYWSQRGAHFVVCKVAPERYRCQFFYSDADHYGTGLDDYTDLKTCVLTLLRVQADHESRSASISGGAAALESATIAPDDEYHGPLVI